jgi:hypothetical protein
LAIQKRFLTALRAGEQNAYLSRDLARIVRTLSFTCDLGDLAYGQFDAQQVRNWLAALEMRSLLHSVPEGLFDFGVPVPTEPAARIEPTVLPEIAQQTVGTRF